MHHRARFRAAALIVTVAATAALACSCTGAPSTTAGPAGGSPPATAAAMGGGASGTASGTGGNPLDLTGPVTATVKQAQVNPIEQAPRATLPAQVTDAQGTAVTVTDTSRILAIDLYGTLARIVFDLGMGDSVVGRDTSTAFPQAAHVPLVTVDGHTLSAEAILGLAPSVIITDTSLGPWDVILQMREAGIPVVVVDSHRSIETVTPLITQVADALGVPDAGARLAQRTQRELDSAAAQVTASMPADVADRPRVAFLYVRGQAGVYYMFGTGSGADSLITAIGGRDVATEIGWDGMHPITDEGLVSAAPDVILTMTGGLESAGGVDGLLERLPALAQTPAGQHRRIIDMADADILSFGPGTPAVVTALAAALLTPGAGS